MPTVIHELADAFLRRKQALAEKGQAKTKLAGSDYFMPKSAKDDLNNRLSVFEQGGLPELLKQAGKEMYDNPIVNTAIGLTPVVGDIQAAGETVAALQRGAPWQETAGYAAGILPFVPMIGKTVWHGSPHTFDKFDLSKIGTGEGAQAYGHGLYLADAPETAKSYIANSAVSKEIGAKFLPKAREGSAPQEIYQMYAAGYTPQAVNYAIEKIAANEGPSSSYLKSMVKAQNKMLREVEKTGSLYKVDLPDEQIAKMLDWDKPLSEQPEIQQAFVNHLVENQRLSPKRASDFLKDKTAGEAYGTLSGRNNQEIISQSLLERGIPGIQYLDQASRGAGEGTRNYVVFSDEIPKILERNGTSVFEFPKD